jgi:hypothetical protein
MNKPLIFAGALLAAFLLFRPKASAAAAPSNPGSATVAERPTAEQARAALQAIKARHGAEIARNVERIYRLETRDFTSGGYHATNTAGMKAAGNTPEVFPYGWSRRNMTEANTGPVWYAKDNLEGGSAVPWVVFRKFEDAAEFLARVLKERGNDPARWAGKEGQAAVSYRAAVLAQRTPFTDGN